MRPSSFSCRTRRLKGGTPAPTCCASAREDDAGLVGDQPEISSRPGRWTRQVDPGQPRDDGLELGVIGQPFSEGDARIVARADAA